MKKFFLLPIVTVIFVFFSCDKDINNSIDTSETISFSANSVQPLLLTKADAVTSSTLEESGFYVSATTGEAGSESEVWTSVPFSLSGDVFIGGKLWPSSNDNPYHFYASNVPLTFSEEGAVVDASASTDVVCAYLADPVYKETNLLEFEHIFGTIGAVTVEALEDYVLSDVSVKITPRVSGSYDIQTAAWSETVEGQETVIASAAGNNANNLWLVPGTYSLSVFWRAAKGDYSEAFSNKVVDVDIVSGAINSIRLGLKGQSDEISFRISVRSMNENSIDAGDILAQTTPEVPITGTFGGLEITPAPLYYNGHSFEIKDSDWNHGLIKDNIAGLNEGSYKFYFYHVGSHFDADGRYFNMYSGDIDNTNTLSYLGHDDWRVPSKEEWELIIDGPRAGATLNGTPGVRHVNIQLTDYLLDLNTGYGEQCVTGLLLFPDNIEFAGNINEFYDNYSSYADLTLNELSYFTQNGCVFLPDGYYTGYLSSTAVRDTFNNRLYFGDNWYISDSISSYFHLLPSDNYYRVNLIRGGNSPLPSSSHGPTFNGYSIAPSALTYDGSKFVINEGEDWRNDSYMEKAGLVSGSYFFDFLELGSYFDSDRELFDINSGSIDNTYCVSYNGFNDWKLPSAIFDHVSYYGANHSFYFITGFNGSPINSSDNFLLTAGVTISNPDYSDCNSLCGYLIFPDSFVPIIGKEIISSSYTFNPGECNQNTLTMSELQEYLEQGCCFLPACGSVFEPNEPEMTYWSDRGGSHGFYYHTGCEYTQGGTSMCGFVEDPASKSGSYGMVRLIRFAYNDILH